MCAGRLPREDAYGRASNVAALEVFTKPEREVALPVRAPIGGPLEQGHEVEDVVDGAYIVDGWCKRGIPKRTEARGAWIDR